MGSTLKILDKAIVEAEQGLATLRAERAALVDIKTPMPKESNGAVKKPTGDIVKKLEKLPAVFALAQAKKVFAHPIALAQLTRRGLIKKNGNEYQKISPEAP
jgi:hypothetical protein